MFIVWVGLSVLAVAVVKAVAEMHDERVQAAWQAQVTAAAEVQKEEALLRREARQVQRDAEKAARQDQVFGFWERHVAQATPLVFTINDREVGARVAAVQPKGVIIQDGIDECVFLPYERLQWHEGTEDDLQNPEMGLVPPPGEEPADLDEDDPR